MKAKLISSLFLIGMIMISCGKSQTKIEYAGDDISGKVEILRDKSTKKTTLRVDLDEEWAIYRGDAIDLISFKDLVMRGAGSGVFPLNVATDRRSYFLFVTKSSKMLLAEKHLPMAGGYNFRDMGGLKTKDGRFVKWGKVFRADELGSLTNEDLRYLSTIPLVTVVDFRSESEIAEAPDRLPKGLENHQLLSIGPGAFNMAGFADISDLIKEKGVDEVMESMNRSFSTDSICIDRYRKYFKALQVDSDVPLLFHCTAGKDRTGMGAALFLYALGVDDEVIFNDYLSSNIYLEPKYALMKAKYPEMDGMFSVKKEYLQAGIDEIIKNYGSVEKFLKDMLNVDLEKMRKEFLY